MTVERLRVQPPTPLSSGLRRFRRVTGVAAFAILAAGFLATSAAQPAEAFVADGGQAPASQEKAAREAKAAQEKQAREEKAAQEKQAREAKKKASEEKAAQEKAAREAKKKASTPPVPVPVPTPEPKKGESEGTTRFPQPDGQDVVEEVGGTALEKPLEKIRGIAGKAAKYGVKALGWIGTIFQANHEAGHVEKSCHETGDCNPGTRWPEVDSTGYICPDPNNPSKDCQPTEVR